MHLTTTDVARKVGSPAGGKQQYVKNAFSFQAQRTITSTVLLPTLIAGSKNIFLRHRDYFAEHLISFRWRTLVSAVPKGDDKDGAFWL